MGYRDNTKLIEDMKARANAFTQALIDQLTAKGHEVRSNDPCASNSQWIGAGLLRINSVDGLSISYEMNYQRSTGYQADYTGLLSLTLSAFGQRQAYREPKKGFNLDKVEERILTQVNFEKAHKEREARRTALLKGNGEKRDQMAEAFRNAGVKAEIELMGGYHHTYAHNLPSVQIEMTVEEAQAVAKLLQEMRKA